MTEIQMEEAFARAIRLGLAELLSPERGEKAVPRVGPFGINACFPGCSTRAFNPGDYPGMTLLGRKAEAVRYLRACRSDMIRDWTAGWRSKEEGWKGGGEGGFLFAYPEAAAVLSGV